MSEAVLTETHHALLFAWISRAIVQRVGEPQGAAAVRRAVRRYGEQRGGRMAQRAQADGQELSMTNFLVYGEWRYSDPAHAESEKAVAPPNYQTFVKRCPWNTAWLEAELLQYGRLYCLEIDRAL
ncbi:MAG: L-2-amino-thiazoline-4-carboxylic acid hydrolase, partial [Anaerolineales bacterium]|nr:L-2-amino-thiazoline-4-carboxylic acid hydrolase [Anaerolineales bacterium]